MDILCLKRKMCLKHSIVNANDSGQTCLHSSQRNYMKSHCVLKTMATEIFYCNYFTLYATFLYILLEHLKGAFR